jgi:hypothetical protein
MTVAADAPLPTPKIEYDDSEKELRRTLVLEIRATRINWTLDLAELDSSN